MKKTTLYFLMFMIIGGIVLAIGSTTLTTPTVTFTATDNNVEHTCGGDAFLGWNITAIYLYSNAGGTWKVENAVNLSTPVNNTAREITTNIDHTPYGSNYVWNCRTNYTVSNSTQFNLTWAPQNYTVFIPYIGITTLAKPVDGYYPLNDSINFTINGSAELGYNITSIHFYTNSTGSWAADRSFIIEDPTNNTAVGRDFDLTGETDGTHLLWGAMINYTKHNLSTNSSITFSTENRTLFIEFPPPITLNSPTANQFLNTPTNIFNLTALNTYADSGTLNCHVYVNESASWIPRGATLVSNDNEPSTTFLSFQDGTYIWSARCWEQANSNIIGFANANNTFTIDLTDPTVSIDFTDETFITTSAFGVAVTATDTNIDSCNLFVNITGGNIVLNSTNSSITSGEEFFFNLTYDDGNYTFYTGCNDTASNWINSSQFEVKIDTKAPSIIAANVSNYTRNGFCDQWDINYTSNEDSNATINFGTSTSLGTFVYNSSFSSTKSLHLPSQEENTPYFFNLTVCDKAGNCNDSLTQFDYIFPFKICSGWTYLGNYESRINMSDILEQSGADQVYTWNETGQIWEFEIGTGVKGDMELLYGVDEIILFNADNSTWFQNRTGSGLGGTVYYNMNITSGDNYLAMVENISFGDLKSQLMNASDSWGTPTSETPDTIAGGLVFNISYHDAYNNSALDWVGGFTYDVDFNWTWNNNTLLGNSTGIEVVWLYSPFNITWNGSAIIANWTAE